MLASYKKDHGKTCAAAQREEEERIDDDLDFEAAKSTKYITHFMRRPVTEKGSPAATSCFYLRDE